MATTDTNKFAEIDINKILTIVKDNKRPEDGSQCPIFAKTIAKRLGISSFRKYPDRNNLLDLIKDHPNLRRCDYDKRGDVEYVSDATLRFEEEELAEEARLFKEADVVYEALLEDVHDGVHEHAEFEIRYDRGNWITFHSDKLRYDLSVDRHLHRGTASIRCDIDPQFDSPYKKMKTIKVRGNSLEAILQAAQEVQTLFENLHELGVTTR